MNQQDISDVKTRARLNELRKMYVLEGGIEEKSDQAAEALFLAKQTDPSLTVKQWLVAHPEYQPAPQKQMTVEEQRQAQLDRPNSMYKVF